MSGLTRTTSVKRTYQPYQLYRRGKLWIKHEFDASGQDEQMINNQFVDIWPVDFRENPTDGNLVWTRMRQEVVGQPGAYYWSLYANKPCAVDMKIHYEKADDYNDAPPSFYEFKFDAGVFGSGWLRTYVTDWENVVPDGTSPEGRPAYSIIDNPDTMVQKFWGPCSWQISDYHKLLPGQWIQFAYTNNGKSDPLPRCEIDNLTIYPYYQLNCEVARLAPGRPDTQPKKIQVLRGYNAFQTTTRVSTVFDVTLRFYNAMSYNDFTRSIQEPHVICDEQGILYRGVLELEGTDYYGSGVYEQKLKFYSHSKLGVGWI
jgi:hypothetical protein